MRVVALHPLQQEILVMQGLRPTANGVIDMALAPFRYAFPNASFPTAAVHEFITESKETSSATSGFVAGILTALMKNTGTAIWISTSRKIFPPALKSFGIEPDRLIFVDLQKEKDVMWAMDEALKCDALSAVVAEMQDLSFTESRRLQLAVEHSRVTGLVLRPNPRKISTTACVSRWRIAPALTEPIHGHRNFSEGDDDMPGIGFPQWKVDLLRIRNGRPGSWNIKWEDGKFKSLDRLPLEVKEQERNAG